MSHPKSPLAPGLWHSMWRRGYYPHSGVVHWQLDKLPFNPFLRLCKTFLSMGVCVPFISGYFAHSHSISLLIFFCVRGWGGISADRRCLRLLVVLIVDREMHAAAAAAAAGARRLSRPRVHLD